MLFSTKKWDLPDEYTKTLGNFVAFTSKLKTLGYHCRVCQHGVIKTTETVVGIIPCLTHEESDKMVRKRNSLSGSIVLTDNLSLCCMDRYSTSQTWAVNETLEDEIGQFLGFLTWTTHFGRHFCTASILNYLPCGEILIPFEIKSPQFFLFLMLFLSFFDFLNP